MNRKTRKLTTVLTGILLVVAGMATGWWWGQRAPSQGPEAISADRKPSKEREVLYWYDPMSPQHHFDKPGKSPFMDMDLVPKYASADAADQPGDFSLRISPQITQNIGLREATVTRIPLETAIEATGLLAFNGANSPSSRPAAPHWWSVCGHWRPAMSSRQANHWWKCWSRNGARRRPNSWPCAREMTTHCARARANVCACSACQRHPSQNWSSPDVHGRASF